MISNLRHRLNKRATAVAMVMLIVLAGSGISSSALLTDKITASLNGSLTTINVNANGNKSVSFTIPAGKISGEYIPFPVQITNTGTGYARFLPVLTGLSGTTALTGSTYTKWWSGMAPEQCVSTNPDISDPALFAMQAVGQMSSLSAGPLFNEFQVDAGGTANICLIIKLGDPAGGAGNFGATWDWNAWYP